jgi:SPOR domain
MSERLEIDPEEREEHEDGEAPAPQRHRLRAILLSLLVVCVAGLSWWTYETAKPPKFPAKVPEIHPDAAPVKEAPANPGGMVVPDQDSALLNREGKSNAKAEQLLPPAEPVLPRPVAPAPPAKITTPPPPPSPAAASSPSAPAPVAAAPSAVPVAPAAIPERAQPATTQSAKAPRPTAAPAAAGAGWRLQLGAVRSEAAAKEEWQRLKAKQPDLLGKLNLSTPRVDLGSKGVFYRIQAGPIADGATAEQNCATLKSRHVGCLLVKP